MDALSPSARWHSFRPKPGMHGCWSLQVNLLPDSPATGIQNPSTSRKPTRITPSAGKGIYRIEGRAFLYIERKSWRIITILGYPTAEIARLGLTRLSQLGAKMSYFSG